MGMAKDYLIRVFYKFKNYLLYYLWFVICGFALSLIATPIWDVFIYNTWRSQLDQLDVLFVYNYKSLIDLISWDLRVVPFLIIIAAIAFASYKGFQTLIRGSLMILGASFVFNNFTLRIGLLDVNYWKEPTSTLALILNFSLVLIFIDIILYLLNDVFGPPFFSFLKTIKFQAKPLGLKIEIDIAKAIEKINQLSNRNKDLWLDDSDEPLTNLSQIQTITKVSGNSNELFIVFQKKLEEVESLILDKDKNKSAVSVCLDGAWGSGKTSLINIAHGFVSGTEGNGVLWIDFNPWNFSNTTELIQSFFDNLDRELAKKYRVNLQPNLKLYVDLITPVIESAGIFGSIRSFLLELPFLAGQNIERLRNEISKKIKKFPIKLSSFWMI